MSWERINQDSRSSAPRERIRGFMSFTEGSNVEGTLESVHVNNGKGFFVIRASKSCTIAVKDESSKTGLGKAEISELVGVRKCGATKVLARLPLGTLVSITYLGMTEKPGFNPKTQQEEMNPAHDITVDVYRQEGEE